MAVRTLKIACGLLLAGFCLATTVSACFGPKLYVGVGQGAASEVMYALVTLYVQEKTGVESIRVDLEAQQDPLLELAEERLDLALVQMAAEPAENTLLSVPEFPALVSGQRPLEELQFTTVAPAIRKLSGLLTKDDVTSLVKQVEAGESAMAAVRRLLMERRWI